MDRSSSRSLGVEDARSEGFEDYGIITRIDGSDRATGEICRNVTDEPRRQNERCVSLSIAVTLMSRESVAGPRDVFLAGNANCPNVLSAPG